MTNRALKPGVVAMSSALVVLMSTGSVGLAGAPGEAIYDEHCAGCHGKRGVMKILHQRSEKGRERALGGPHMRHHVPDVADRSAVISYLKQMIEK